MSVFIVGSYVNAHCLRVGRLPVRGESVDAQAMWDEHGGKGLNFAIGIHRLGAGAQTLLAVGDDAAGEACIRFMESEGLTAQSVVKVGGQSGFGVGLIAVDGSNLIAVYPGANALLDDEHVYSCWPALRKSRLICAQFEVGDLPIISAFRYARSQGVTTLLNPSPWRELTDDLLSLIDILVLNETEAALLLCLDRDVRLSPDQWGQVLLHYPWPSTLTLLVITLAEQGCIALSHEGVVMHQPAYVIDLVDPTGAGDAFTAALAVAWEKRGDLKQCLRFANACGAIVAAQQGVLAVLPTREQVEQFMLEQCSSST